MLGLPMEFVQAAVYDRPGQDTPMGWGIKLAVGVVILMAYMVVVAVPGALLFGPQTTGWEMVRAGAVLVAALLCIVMVKTAIRAGGEF